MSRKSDYSLILVTDKVLVRADFVGKHLQSSGPLMVHEPVPNGSLIENVQKAIESGAPIARNVAILSSDVWNQIVSVPTLSVESVERDQLAEALKFEVEPLIGIDPDQSTLGFAPLGTEGELTRYWVNACPKSDWQEIQSLLRGTKARDLIVAHPVVSSNATGESRIEFWDQSVFGTVSSGQVDRVNNSNATADRWATDFGYANVDEAVKGNRILLGPGSERSDLPANANLVVDLKDKEQLVQWLTDSARTLRDQNSELPVIRPARKKAGSNIHWLIRAAALMAVVAFCGWHLTWLKTRDFQIQQELTSLELPGIEKQKFDSMLGDVIQKREETLHESLQTKADLQKVRFFFENQTDRLHKLMNELVKLRTSDLVIRGLAVSEEGTTVSGFSLNSDAAPMLTNQLREVMTQAGWKIHPPSQQGLLKMVNGGPWTFTILLEDVGPPSSIETRSNIVSSRKLNGAKP